MANATYINCETRRRPLFSVVVATYNRPSMLREALQSICAQTVTDFECIVIDDASDTAGAVLPKDPRFRLVSLESNRGLAGVWNLGVGEAIGEHVAFLDDDDLWTPQRLAIAKSHIDEADVVVCAGSLIGSESTARFEVMNGNVHDTILNSFTPNMGRTSIRRARMLPFDESFKASQDIEWWLRQSLEAEVVFDCRLGHLSRQHSGVRTGIGPSARIDAGHRLLAENREYFRRHATAKAFRQYRLGMMYLVAGNLKKAWTFTISSLMSRPSGRAVRLLTRALLASFPPSRARQRR